MSALKTQPNEHDVEEFLRGVDHDQRRADALQLLEWMQEITGEQPRMWGASMVGFGSYHYKYESGREGDWFITGFSPRKQNLTIYIMPGFNRYEELMGRLGKYKTGKSCLYLNRLSDADAEILKELIAASYQYMQAKHHS